MSIENKDPFKCAACGTVNAWNRTDCRTCGAPRGEEAEETEARKLEDDASQAAPPTADTTGPRPVGAAVSEGPSARRRLNAFWIFLGIALHVVSIHLGVFSIIKVFIEPDPQLKSTIEQTLEAAKSGDAEKASILETLPEEIKSKILNIQVILIAMLLLSPLLIGVATGFFSGSVLEGAASMGLSAVLISVLNGAAKVALFVGPLNAGIGALGAYLGFRLARRLRESSLSDAKT